MRSTNWLVTSISETLRPSLSCSWCCVRLVNTHRKESDPKQDLSRTMVLLLVMFQTMPSLFAVDNVGSHHGGPIVLLGTMTGVGLLCCATT